MSKLLLDESVDRIIEDKLEGRGIDTVRQPKAKRDQAVLEAAIAEDAPLLTRDQSDYVRLSQSMEHPGIIIDKYMHRRDRTLVADTVAGLLREHPGSVENTVQYLSNWLGMF